MLVAAHSGGIDSARLKPSDNRSLVSSEAQESVQQGTPGSFIRDMKDQAVLKWHDGTKAPEKYAGVSVSSVRSTSSATLKATHHQTEEVLARTEDRDFFGCLPFCVGETLLTKV